MNQTATTPSETEQALRERVKELACLYTIAQVSGKPTSSISEIMQGVVDVLPTAWQFPEAAQASIELDGHVFMAGSGHAHTECQNAAIIVRGMARGRIEVCYTAPQRPGLSRVFLPDEQRLLDEVARQLGLIVDRKETAAEQERLQAKLRHADRLATIGQLAAGVAHEMNEPLGAILGFAQLLAKASGLPRQAMDDIGKIESAALHARETIRRLMTFARQTPPRDVRVNINRLIEESAGIWSPRCAAEDVRVEYVLDESISEIVADDGQLRQVVTNLAVNAVQSMPAGGVLRIETIRHEDWFELRVTDTGTGIASDILPRIFDPFFTTKDVDQGTGLGLSVVHGIVSGHGGRISVDSKPGRGTCVKVRLPIYRPPEPTQQNGGSNAKA